MPLPEVRDICLLEPWNKGYIKTVNDKKAARQAAKVAHSVVTASVSSPEPITVQNPDGMDRPSNLFSHSPQVVAADAIIRPEVLGKRVEKAVRLLLGLVIKLEAANILTWRQLGVDAAYDRRYREIDAVWLSDYDAVSIYEIKHTSTSRMNALAGADQLALSARVLRQRYRIVRQRLVYVGEDPMRHIGPFHNVDVADERHERGIVWIAPAQIKWAAASLGFALPQNWRKDAAPIPRPTFSPEAGQPSLLQDATA